MLIPLSILLSIFCNFFGANTSVIAMPLETDQLLRIQQLTSVFENSEIAFNYAYVENLHDGRGYTAGRAGFCTGTGDLLPLVEKYTRLNSRNPLAKYLSELRRLASLTGKPAASTRALHGFAKAWKLAARDEAYRKLQDQELEIDYLNPALAKADELQAKLPITAGMLFDTFIQHGADAGPDGALTIIQETENEAGLLENGTDELSWLICFMRIRERHLQNPADPATRQEWRNSVGRVYVYEQLLEDGYWDFSGPKRVSFYGQEFLIP